MKKSVLLLWCLPLITGLLLFILGLFSGSTIDFNHNVDWSIVRICLATFALLIALTPLYISLAKHISSMRSSRRWINIRVTQIDQLITPYDPEDESTKESGIKERLHKDTRDALLEFAIECRDIPSLSREEEESLERLLISLYSFVTPAIGTPEETLGKKSSKFRARLDTFQRVVNEHSGKG